MTTKSVMSSREMDRALARMAHEIVEYNKGTSGLVLIGIRTGGAPLANRLAAEIAQAEGSEPPKGVLDINLYRDDWSRLGQHPVVRKTEIPFSIDEQTVVLVDDVIYTGRTIRAALDALMDFGRPRRIQLAVLVDRGRRELPIQPDYVGLSLQTSSQEHVNVFLREISGRDEVVIEQHHTADVP